MPLNVYDYSPFKLILKTRNYSICLISTYAFTDTAILAHELQPSKIKGTVDVISYGPPEIE